MTESCGTTQPTRRTLLLGSAAWRATGWGMLAAAAVPDTWRSAPTGLSRDGGVAGAAGASVGSAQGDAVRTAAFEEFAASVKNALREVSEQAIRDLHAAGVPAATIDAAGRLIWRMPDGTAMPMTDPSRLPGSDRKAGRIQIRGARTAVVTAPDTSGLLRAEAEVLDGR